METLANKIVKSVRFPFELHIDITNHCNMKCSVCPMAARYTEPIMPLGYMDFELYKNIIDQCHAHHWTGYEINLHKDGEPLMHDRIGDMIQYAKSKGAFVHFATNGLLLMKRKDDLINSGLDLLTVSLTEEWQTRELAKFMEYRGKYGPFTQAKLYNEYRLFEIPDVDRVFFSNLHNFTNPGAERRAPCRKLLYNPAITWDGEFVLCCVDYKREGVVGNVKEDTIENLWNKVRQVYFDQCMTYFTSPCDKCTYCETLKMEETKCHLEL